MGYLVRWMLHGLPLSASPRQRIKGLRASGMHQANELLGQMFSLLWLSRASRPFKKQVRWNLDI